MCIAVTSHRMMAGAPMTPSLHRRAQHSTRLGETPEPLWPSAIQAKGWSIYGAQRAQPVATGGKWNTPENRSNKPIRNRWQPTATVSERMVRRGSTVRFRRRLTAKRALRSASCGLPVSGDQLTDSSP
jgi:hypothetical protein